MEQKPLQYWKDIIIVHRRRLHSSAVTNDDQDDNVHGDDVVNDISWISEMPFRTPSGFESSERDRQEDSLFLTPPPSDRKPIKREFDDGLSPQEVNALYDDPDTEEFRERLKPGKRLKVETTPTRGVYPIKHVERTEPGKHDQ